MRCTFYRSTGWYYYEIKYNKVIYIKLDENGTVGSSSIFEIEIPKHARQLPLHILMHPTRIHHGPSHLGSWPTTRDH